MKEILREAYGVTKGQFQDIASAVLAVVGAVSFVFGRPVLSAVLLGVAYLLKDWELRIYRRTAP